MPSSSDICLLYLTMPSAEVAGDLARRMLEARLIACANIFPPHRALYRWEAAIEESAEVAVVLKTRTVLVSAVAEFVKSHHPYEIPALVEIPVSGGLPAFLDWIRSETLDKV